MGLGDEAIARLSAMAAGQVGPSARRRVGAKPAARGWGRWLGEPRAAVLIVLFLVVGIGGGRKLLQGWRGRKAVIRLAEPDVTVADIEAAVPHGREGLMDLFRLLGTADSAEMRQAAGHALSVIWARDDLIAEEEQALVRRGFTVTWRARRRYPRALRSPIPIGVSYGLPFLREGGGGIAPTNLEWSHVILGARRATLESPSPWKAGPVEASFTLIPGDFETNGPHRLVLQSKARTAGLSESWELALPQMPLSIEFDPLLNVEALFTLADAARAEAFARGVRLVTPDGDEGPASSFLDLNEELALRDPPALVVTTPLPCDLAHAIELEFEGISGRFAAGELVISGQGARGPKAEPSESASASRRFSLGRVGPLPAEVSLSPGRHRLRAILTADADLGWADPDVRSIWPESITTGWAEVQVVRR